MIRKLISLYCVCAVLLCVTVALEMSRSMTADSWVTIASRQGGYAWSGLADVTDTWVSSTKRKYSITLPKSYAEGGLSFLE